MTDREILKRLRAHPRIVRAGIERGELGGEESNPAWIWAFIRVEGRRPVRGDIFTDESCLDDIDGLIKGLLESIDGPPEIAGEALGE